MFLDDSGIFLPVFPSRTNLNGIPDDAICDIAIYADDTTLYSQCDQVSDL